MKNFNDNDIFLKGSPDVKIKIPASALRMRKIIIVTKKVFEIKICFIVIIKLSVCRDNWVPE